MSVMALSFGLVAQVKNTFATSSANFPRKARMILRCDSKLRGGYDHRDAAQNEDGALYGTLSPKTVQTTSTTSCHRVYLTAPCNRPGNSRTILRLGLLLRRAAKTEKTAYPRELA